MCSSFRNFLSLNNRKTEGVEEKIQALEHQMVCLRSEIQDAESSELYLEQCRTTLANITSELEGYRWELRELHRINPVITGNSNAAVDAFIYLKWRHLTKLEIDVRGLTSCYSLTTIPDLSHFANLEELILDGHEHLCSGLDRIPATVRTLSLFKARFKSCDEILRLTKLEKVSFQRNYGLTEMPDLSGMENLQALQLAQTGIRHMPNLPDGLHLVDFPRVVSDVSLSEKRTLRHPFEFESLRINVYGGNSAQKIEIMRAFIRKVRQSNHLRKFLRIREELLEKAARISMHPNRIARLLESGLDFDDLEDRDNLFGYKG
jgi:hypothetical protein